MLSDVLRKVLKYMAYFIFIPDLKHVSTPLLSRPGVCKLARQEIVTYDHRYMMNDFIILDESGTAENKVEVLFSHDKLLLASILRPLHQVTEEMLV